MLINSSFLTKYSAGTKIVIFLQCVFSSYLSFRFLKLVYFNWRLITLQYCGFCHTSPWISHGCTCVPSSWTPLPPPSPPHLPGLSQSTSFECSASCIKLALVIYFIYGNIYASMTTFSRTVKLPFISEQIKKVINKTKSSLNKYLKVPRLYNFQ